MVDKLEDIPHKETTINPHCKAHTTPYQLVNNDNTPLKGPIRHLDQYLEKYEQKIPNHTNYFKMPKYGKMDHEFIFGSETIK